MKERNTIITKGDREKKIDFIVAWVDGTDPNWLKEKQVYDSNSISKYDKNWINGDSRYRDWDLMRYWFRGVETFAPWVNRIWFVTWGHYPEWLNINHPKLRIVNHKDYIPAKYLPTFSSHTIELNLHRISGLEEQFVYFNDDMFLIDKVRPEDFFYKGQPCDTAVLLPITLEQNGIRAEINDMYVINEHFVKKEVMKKNWRAWYSLKYGRLLMRTLLLTPFRLFPGFFINHLPCSYKKQTFIDVWNKVPDILDETCTHKFRATTDVNQWLFEYWQFCTGFFPRNYDFGRYYEGKDLFPEMCDDILHRRHKIICCNDSPELVEFDYYKARLHAAFEGILPNRSEFEKYDR